MIERGFRMIDRGQLINECRKLLESKVDREGLVSYLRGQGCLKLDSIAILRQVFDLSLGEAKGVVHCSAAWQDVRERDDKFHDGLIDEILPELKRERGAE
jgi:hypothetical protein